MSALLKRMLALALFAASVALGAGALSVPAEQAAARQSKRRWAVSATEMTQDGREAAESSTQPKRSERLYGPSLRSV